MIYDKELLDQALLLATKEPKKPKQASLKRAVSTAYYSLFHFIVENTSKQILKNDNSIRNITNRKFDHKIIRDVANKYKNSANSEIANLSMMIITLMEARHIADYNLYSRISRDYVLDLLEEVSKFKLIWKKLNKTNSVEFTAFVTELLFGKPR